MDISKKQRVLAEYFGKEENADKEDIFEVCSDHDESFSSLSRSCARERVPGLWTASWEDLVEDGLSHQDCGAGSDQSPARFTKIHLAAQFSDSVLALLSGRKKDGNEPDYEVLGGLFSPFSERESFHDVKAPVASEEEVEEAAVERSGIADYVMRLLTSEIFNHLQGLPGDRKLYVL